MCDAQRWMCKRLLWLCRLCRLCRRCSRRGGLAGPPTRLLVRELCTLQYTLQKCTLTLQPWKLCSIVCNTPHLLHGQELHQLLLLLQVLRGRSTLPLALAQLCNARIILCGNLAQGLHSEVDLPLQAPKTFSLRLCKDVTWLCNAVEVCRNDVPMQKCCEHAGCAEVLDQCFADCAGMLCLFCAYANLLKYAAPVQVCWTILWLWRYAGLSLCIACFAVLTSASYECCSLC